MYDILPRNPDKGLAVNEVGELSNDQRRKTHEFHGPNTHHTEYIHLHIRPLARQWSLEPHLIVFERCAAYLRASGVPLVECTRMVVEYG